MTKLYTLALPAVKGAATGARHSLDVIIDDKRFSLGDAHKAGYDAKFVGQHPKWDQANHASKPYTCVVRAPEGAKFLHFVARVRNADGVKQASALPWAEAVPAEVKSVADAPALAPKTVREPKAAPARKASTGTDPRIEALEATANAQGLLLAAIASKLGVKA